jgi:hypothetical protein
MKKKITAIALALLLAGCANLTPQQAAILTTATNIARIAASAAATYYGGAQAGAMASAGLDALGQVIQGYVGHPIPSEIVTASPGIRGVGPALITIISPDHAISQADADKVALAARIADTLKSVVVVPKPTAKRDNSQEHWYLDGSPKPKPQYAKGDVRRVSDSIWQQFIDYIFGA